MTEIIVSCATLRLNFCEFAIAISQTRTLPWITSLIPSRWRTSGTMISKLSSLKKRTRFFRAPHQQRKQSMPGSTLGCAGPMAKKIRFKNCCSMASKTDVCYTWWRQSSGMYDGKWHRCPTTRQSWTTCSTRQLSDMYERRWYWCPITARVAQPGPHKLFNYPLHYCAAWLDWQFYAVLQRSLLASSAGIRLMSLPWAAVRAIVCQSTNDTRATTNELAMTNRLHVCS